jgi:hypothetical protein
MNTEIYLTPEELKAIQDMNSELSRMKMTIGDLEMKKSNIIRASDELYFQFSSHEKSLIEKYGEDAIINMQTGQVTKKEAAPKMEIFKN